MHFNEKVNEVLQEIRVCANEAKEAAIALEKTLDQLATAPEDLIESGFQFVCDMQSAANNSMERLGRIQGMYEGRLLK